MMDKSGDIQLNISLREINKALCPECQAKLQEITRDVIAEELARRALGIDSEAKKR